MKKITLLLITCLTISTWSNSQCTTIPGGAYGSITLANDGTAEQIAADNWAAGEYSAVRNLIIGNTYTVTANNTTGMYITVAEIDWDAAAVGGTVLANGSSSVTFTATTDDIIVHWHLNAACETTGDEDTVTTIQCTSATCSCTATMTPDAAASPSPADNATNVPIDTSGTSDAIAFSWTDNGEATSYDFNIPGVGTATGVTNPTNITYAWAYNTTYTWSVTSTNCLGTVTSSTYSFTTEADPTMSVDQFDTNSISYFYNNTNDMLELKSATSTFTNVELYDILGKTVLSKSLNNTEESVDLSSLNSGIYIAKIAINDAVKTVKFVKN